MDVYLKSIVAFKQRLDSEQLHETNKWSSMADVFRQLQEQMCSDVTLVASHLPSASEHLFTSEVQTRMGELYKSDVILNGCSREAEGFGITSELAEFVQRYENNVAAIKEVRCDSWMDFSNLIIAGMDLVTSCYTTVARKAAEENDTTSGGRRAFGGDLNTLHISSKMYAENRTRLVADLRAKVAPGSVVLLQGGIKKNRYNTDAEDLPFRQESYFFWAFGVHESECLGVIDVDSGKALLLPPRLDPSYAVWDGKINDKTWFKNKYGVDDVQFHDANVLVGALKKLNTKKLLVLKAANSDSGNTLEPPEFAGKEQFSVDVDLLYPVIAELRVFKTDRELEVMRYASKIASEAHRTAMQHIRPGLYEYQLESLFRHVSYYNGGCRHLAYTCIAATGCNSSVLHYGHANAPNEKQIKDGDMCLFDMGPEYNCYASDVTTSFPANGKFTENQKIIYNAVLDANRTVLREAKIGVCWTDMHMLAEKIILTHLKAAGLVVGDVDEMVSARVGAVFMPHGLGHFIGLDVHDCGGFLGDATPRPTVPGLKSIRTTRTLRERMVITIEPGCYFIDHLLDGALADPAQSKFLVKDKIAQFRNTGGVRIEDDVVIWAKGNENMSDVPRTVEEIEDLMAGGPRSHDEAAVQKSVENYLKK